MQELEKCWANSFLSQSHNILPEISTWSFCKVASLEKVFFNLLVSTCMTMYYRIEWQNVTEL